jgi:hypothetical protein
VTDGHDERSPDEILADIPLAVRTLKERCEAEHRRPGEWELAELDQFVRATVAAARARWFKERAGGWVLHFNPPRLDEEWWNDIKAKLRKLSPEAEFRAQLAAVESRTANPPEDEPQQPAKRRKSWRKPYPAESVARIVLRVASNSMLSRDDLRHEMYRVEKLGSTTLIDHILNLTRDNRRKGAPFKRLSRTRRAKWERVAAELVEEGGTVTRDDLTKRLK